MRLSDEFHAFKRLDPALRLFGFGGLGFETVDKTLNMSDFALLFFERGLLLREFFLANFLERGIIAGI